MPPPRPASPKPRGVLHPQLNHGQFEHARRVPTPPLAPFVEHYWCVRWDLTGQPPQLQETLPHPNVHLVLERDEARIWGVHSGRFSRWLEGRGTVFGVKFAVGGFYPLLRRPVALLSNRSMPAAPLLDRAIDAAARQLPQCDDIDAMVDRVQPILLAAMPTPDPQGARVRALVQSIAHDSTLTTVTELGRRHGIDQRNLQRLFRTYVGASPKWTINRYRLHEAIERLQSGAPPAWTELALALGYYDQAHFIRDFRRLVGRAPASYLQQLSVAGD
ncbi:MAG: hypothetical protein ABT19_13545 [Rhodanobacter sp. SCN 68-63]|nr:MAG: hypothetical protein ABT19_13545 [Rhodanobacter sp. SCN 68-63]